MKALKIIFWIVMVLVVLVIGLVFVVTRLVDPNDYKPQISSLVQEQTGRTLDLQGDLSLTFFPWIGAETGPVRLSNAPGFGDEPMVAVENARINVKLLPLLKRRVEVDTVVLDSPVIRLHTLADGRTNWDDLAGSGADDGSVRDDESIRDDGKGPAAIAGLAVQGVSINAGQLYWRNDAADQQLDVTGLNLATGTLVPGEPLDVSLALDAAGNMLPEPAHIELDTTVTVSRNMASVALARTTFKLASSRYGADLSLDKVSYALEAGLAALNGVTADVTMDDVASRLELPSLSVNLSDESIEMPGIEITQDDAVITASVSGGGLINPDVSGGISVRSGDVATLLRRNGLSDIELPAKVSDVDVSLSFDMKDHALSLQGLSAKAAVNDQPTSITADSLRYHLKQESLEIPALAVRQGDFRLDGAVSGSNLVSRPAERALSGQVDLALADVAALLVRNGIEAGLPDLPLTDIRLSGGFDMAGSALSAESLSANFSHHGHATRVGAPSLKLDLDSGKLAAPAIRVEQGDFSLQGSASGGNVLDGPAAMQVSGKLVLEAGNLVDALLRNQLVAELPPATPKRVNASLVYALADNNLDVSDLDASLDEMTLAGTVGLRNLQSPGYRFDLRINRLDLDALTAGDGEAAAETPSTGEQLLLPVAPLQGLDVNGRARIGELVTTGMTLNEVDVRVNSADNVLKVAPVTARLFGGSAEANLTYDVSAAAPAIRLAAKTSQLAVGELLKALELTDRIEGTGTLQMDISGQGADATALTSALDGTLSLLLRDGALKGYDLQAALIEIESQVARYQGKEVAETATPEAETRFAEMGASFRINDGVFRNDDFIMKAPLFRVGGNGALDLPGDRLDYKLDVNVVDSVEGQGGAALQDLKGARIPLKIYGPLADLSFTLDLASLLKERAKKELKEKLLEELGGQLGEAAPAAAAPGEPAAASEPAAPPADPKEALEEELKNKLKGSLLKGLGLGG